MNVHQCPLPLGTMTTLRRHTGKKSRYCAFAERASRCEQFRGLIAARSARLCTMTIVGIIVAQVVKELTSVEEICLGDAAEACRLFVRRCSLVAFPESRRQ